MMKENSGLTKFHTFMEGPSRFLFMGLVFFGFLFGVISVFFDATHLTNPARPEFALTILSSLGLAACAVISVLKAINLYAGFIVEREKIAEKTSENLQKVENLFSHIKSVNVGLTNEQNNRISVNFIPTSEADILRDLRVNIKKIQDQIKKNRQKGCHSYIEITNIGRFIFDGIQLTAAPISSALNLIANLIVGLPDNARKGMVTGEIIYTLFAFYCAPEFAKSLSKSNNPHLRNLNEFLKSIVAVTDSRSITEQDLQNLKNMFEKLDLKDFQEEYTIQPLEGKKEFIIPKKGVLELIQKNHFLWKPASSEPGLREIIIENVESTRGEKQRLLGSKQNII
jgi:hypothetical protein